MKSKHIIKSVCLILVIVLLTGLITASKDDDGCDVESYERDWLELKMLYMNRLIYERTCHEKFPMTAEQKDLCVNFYIREVMPLGGKLITTVDGEKYYYPKFYLNYIKPDFEENEYTAYIIEPGSKIRISYLGGVYSGVTVKAIDETPPVPTEAELQAKEINSKLNKFCGSYLTKEELDKRLASFESFSSKYSYSSLGKDGEGNELFCPEFTVLKWVTSAPTENTRYKIVITSRTENGVHDGIFVMSEEISPEYLKRLGLI